MTFVEKVRLLLRLNALIERKGTGCAEELASRLNLSKASIYRYINVLRNLGAKIKYCPQKRSFIYEEEFDLIF